jgi:ABC-2 type transport system permease protein
VSLVLLPLAIVGLLTLGSGIALVVACANVLYRDVGYLLKVIIRLFFYGTPVIFTAEMVPERLRDLFFLNPVSVWISLSRCAILDRPLLFERSHLLLAALASVLSLMLGSILFRRLENRAVKSL